MDSLLKLITTFLLQVIYVSGNEAIVGSSSNSMKNNVASINPIAWYFLTAVDQLAYETALTEQSKSDEIVQISTNSRHKSVIASPPVASSQIHKFSKTVSDTKTEPLVSTKNGVIRGTIESRAHVFYSVPFAQSPTGNLRFQEPKRVGEYQQQPYDSSTPDYRLCYQLTDECEKYPCNMTEDCLVLNINVPLHVDLSDPDAAPDAELPVLVWFYGGFYFRGSATTPKADGQWLANATNSIVVTVNYRVGALGFLAVEDSQGQIFCNQGLKDQQLALEWLQENIASFGGDKYKVTIFGESAGAQSVMFHLTSARSKNLFQRGVMQSNPAAFQYSNISHSIDTVTALVLQELNCSVTNTSCLWTASADELTQTRNKVMVRSLLAGEFFDGVEPFRPVIDGSDVVAQPLELFQQGRWHSDKSVIVGTNSEEMAYVSAVLERIPVPFSLFQRLNEFVLGTDAAEQVVDAYKELAGPFPGPLYDYTDILAKEVTEMLFTCPNRALARFASCTVSNDASIYLYLDAFPLNDPGCSEGFSFSRVCNTAFHSSEVPLVLKTEQGYQMTFSEEDHLISNMLSSYWGSFAWSGSPTPTVLESLGTFSNWDSHIEEDGWKILQLQLPQSVIDIDYQQQICDMWDSTNFYVTLRNYTDVTETSTIEPARTSVGQKDPLPTTVAGSASFHFLNRTSSSPIIMLMVLVTVHNIYFSV